jgi:predicted AlkP superfamily pyrophosphatase or phosphodiesterase
MIKQFLGLLLIALGCLPASAARPKPPVTILISIDGFRADYLNRGLTPNLAALAAKGVRAAMRPSFPTKTFPNHYTLVTGLRPDRHGIVGNKFQDAARPNVTFKMSDSADVFWWKAAEPIWIAAERAGIRTATMFWPASNVAFDGIRPRDWHAYDEHVDDGQRVDAIVDWLRRPTPARPRFLTLYFDTLDTAGHDHGPDSAEVNAALRAIDAQIGRLHTALTGLGQPANLIVVADHGMAATSPDRVVLVKDIADPADFRVIETGPYAAIDPVAGHEAALEKSLLAPHPHILCRRKADLPAALHFGRNPRVSAYLCMADPGWLVLEKVPDDGVDLGSHGYAPDNPDMLALFIAAGPAIRAAGRLPGFDNVDVYPLLRRLIGLPPQPGIDGSDAPFGGSAAFKVKAVAPAQAGAHVWRNKRHLGG